MMIYLIHILISILRLLTYAIMHYIDLSTRGEYTYVSISESRSCARIRFNDYRVISKQQL